MSFLNLRTKFERYCYRNRDKGIPNLMLYVCIGAAIVYLMGMINGGNILYEYLRFDKAAIFRGQVWRLFTYVFTYTPGGGVLTLLFLYFFYSLSRHVELSMGTFRFNLYYFSGVILMDIFALLFCPTSDIIMGTTLVPLDYFNYYIYGNMAYYMHLCILLTYATANPDAHFLVLFIIPVKAWILGAVYLLLIGIEVINMSIPLALFPHNLFPLVGLLNYLLFAGKDVLNLFPFIKRRPAYKQPRRTVTVVRKEKAETSAYTHRCCVCGRTDISHPALEFRYCSRCNGYFCYCEDHINNHSHVE